MESFPFILIALIVLALITRPFTVLFHELGHAIPAIIMTKQPVSIYIGSYGDPKKSWHFSIGLLEVWLRYNPLSWRLGFCIPSANEISINKKIIYTLSGPLASVVIAVLACYFTFSFDLHGSIKILLIIFLGSAIVDLFVNLIPKARPTQLYDGRAVYNDGYRLKQLFYYKQLPKEHVQAIELYNQGEYAKAAISFSQILVADFKDEEIYRLAINAFLQVKNYSRAKDLSDAFPTEWKMNANDFVNAGIAYSQLGLHDEAIILYDKSIELNPNNKYTLNNKGFTLTILERFEEAIPLFDKAIKIDKTFAYSYNNRGLAKIKIGKEGEGLEDINYSLKLDATNSYTFRNLGIYHLDKGAYSKAFDLFTKAQSLDPDTYMIDVLISKATKREK